MKQSYSINPTKSFGPCPSCRFIKKNVSEAESVSIFRWVGEMAFQLCWAYLKEVTHYPVSLFSYEALSKKPSTADRHQNIFQNHRTTIKAFLVVTQCWLIKELPTFQRILMMSSSGSSSTGAAAALVLLDPYYEDPLKCW